MDGESAGKQGGKCVARTLYVLEERGCDSMLVKWDKLGVLRTPVTTVPTANHHYLPSRKNYPGSELTGK